MKHGPFILTIFLTFLSLFEVTWLVIGIMFHVQGSSIINVLKLSKVGVFYCWANTVCISVLFIFVMLSSSLSCLHQKTELSTTPRRARAVKMKTKMNMNMKTYSTPTLHGESIQTTIHIGNKAIRDGRRHPHSHNVAHGISQKIAYFFMTDDWMSTPQKKCNCLY